MGCILYELATGNRAFDSDWAVFLYSSSQKDMDIVLDNTFDAHSIEVITKHVVDMLQIESSARPSASILSKEFTREFQHITEGNNSIPILPSHLIGVPLYSVAGKGDVEAVKILLNARVDVAAKDNLGQTALHLAAWFGRKQPSCAADCAG